LPSSGLMSASAERGHAVALGYVREVTLSDSRAAKRPGNAQGISVVH
jgi:hypothetical protein